MVVAEYAGWSVDPGLLFRNSMAGGGDRMSAYATPIEVLIFMVVVAGSLIVAPMVRAKVVGMKRRKQ